jgi:hypothetical protein
MTNPTKPDSGLPKLACQVRGSLASTLSGSILEEYEKRIFDAFRIPGLDDPEEPKLYMQALEEAPDGALVPWAGLGPLPARIEMHRGQLWMIGTFPWDREGPSPQFFCAKVIGWRNGPELYTKPDGIDTRVCGKGTELHIHLNLSALP